MLSPISPSAAQTRNNAALDSTRANSQSARNQPESTDSATDASTTPEEQSSSTAGQSGPEAAQPDNTAAALTASQAQAIITDNLDKIATGEIAPVVQELSSSRFTLTVATTAADAATAADTIGRLLARDGASADLAASTSIIAAARAEQIDNGISDENLASFDKAIETLIIQRFLSATGNPDADPVLLSESRDTLQLSNFIATTDQDAFFTATVAVAVANANFLNVEPDETVDLSEASPQELGSAAADAADRLGRLAGEFRRNDAYFETRTELATIRAQVQANGANPLQLSAFDNAVATISRERAFEILGSPLFDVDALREARAMLKSGELEALSNPTPEFEAELASTVGQLISSAIDAPIDTALATEIAALTDRDILNRLNDVALNNASKVSGELLFFPEEQEELIPRQGDAPTEYAAIRAQLKADGATEEQLADLDDFFTQNIIQKAISNLDVELTESGITRNDIGLTGSIENEQPLAVNRTALLREARLDDDSVLTESELRPIQEVLSIALQYEAGTEFSSGNLSLANFGELVSLLSEAADAIAEALVSNDDATLQRGLELFDQVRDEIVRRTPVNMLPSSFISAFERRIADAQSALKAPGPEADARLANSSAAILDALTNLAVDAPFGIVAQSSFEGDNGAEPVNIFVIELKPASGSNDTAQFAGHDVIVTNVIERQLQEAGQSYELTTIQTSAGGSATADAIVSVAEMAEELEGPTYLNLSLGQGLSFADMRRAFTLLSDTDFVPEEVGDILPVPTVFDVFADSVRSIALASLDPESDVAKRLNRGGVLAIWQRTGQAIQAIETAAAAGIDVFVATPNSNIEVSAYQFVNDDGLAGSITRVAATTPANVFTSNDFVLPEQGEDFPEDESAPNGIALEDSSRSFYRGEGVDAYAPGVTDGGLNESRIFGSSFATPEMLVNAVLGRFDPSTETRINGEMVA